MTEAKTGIELIAAERQRQIDVEGFTPEHDAGHVDGEISLAAACYASPRKLYVIEPHFGGIGFADPWPWDQAYDGRPYDNEEEESLYGEDVPAEERIRCLEKAGALIAAEIDRLLARNQTEEG